MKAPSLDSLLGHYFPWLSPQQRAQLHALEVAYTEENQRLNLVSRQDMHAFTIHHLLHVLGAARCFSPCLSSRIIDLGTGGGLPGLPLAICFPHAHFTLVDSREKKLAAVARLATAASLDNVTCLHERIERLHATEPYDLALGRAVAPLGRLLSWLNRHAKRHMHPLAHTLCYWCPLEGLPPLLPQTAQWHALATHYPSQPWFESKGLLLLPL